MQKIKHLHKKPLFWLIVVILLFVTQLILITPGSPPNVSQLNDPKITTTPQTQATTPQDLIQGKQQAPANDLTGEQKTLVGLLDVLGYLFVAIILLSSVAWISGTGMKS